MSAWVYSGPAQFAVLEPLASGKSSLQVLIAAFLVNLRFLPMSAALAPHFGGVRRVKLLLSSLVTSSAPAVSSFPIFSLKKNMKTLNPKRTNSRCPMVNAIITSFSAWG